MWRSGPIHRYRVGSQGNKPRSGLCWQRAQGKVSSNCLSHVARYWVVVWILILNLIAMLTTDYLIHLMSVLNGSLYSKSFLMDHGWIMMHRLTVAHGSWSIKGLMHERSSSYWSVGIRLIRRYVPCRPVMVAIRCWVVTYEWAQDTQCHLYNQAVDPTPRQDNHYPPNLCHQSDWQVWCVYI
jgi:hypothetical protein